MTIDSKKMSPVAFVLNLLMSALFFPVVTLLLAGNWRWVEGWIIGLWLVVLPLDAERFQWLPVFPLWLKIAGGVVLIPALYLIERATIDNTYLSAMVRIQNERKQRVITTGVYGFVRHPLYLGCILLMFDAPLLVGSITV